MTNATEDPLNHFLDGVEGQLSDEEEPPWLVYGPKWAQDEGADSPPEDMEEPVWAPSAGWMEKGEAPLKSTSGPSEPVALYAPDDLDVEE